MVDIDNIWVLQGACFNIYYDPFWGFNCAVIAMHHQDKPKHLWKVSYSRQLEYFRAGIVVALPPNQDLISAYLVTFFLMLELSSCTFVLTPFRHLILVP